MTQKFVEIRDRGTFISALAISISGADGYLARRAGFGDTTCVLLVNLAKCEAHWDPYGWNLRAGRTMRAAHLWLWEHWDEHQDGGVIDVEFLLGVTEAPKQSEAQTVGGLT